MKRTFTICYLLVALSWKPAWGYSQMLAVGSSPVLLTQKDSSTKPLKTALAELEKRFNVFIVADDALLEGKQAEDSNNQNSLDEALTQVLRNSELSYKKIKDKIYVVKQAGAKDEKKIKKGIEPAASSTIINEPLSDVQTNPIAQETKTSESASRLFDRTISGKVTDNSGTALPGVTIVLKGTVIGTSTDVNGNYSLTVPDGPNTIIFSYVGFTSKEVNINNETNVNVTLAGNAKALGEVVVVGYGTQKQREVTGAVGSVSSDQISSVIVTGLDQAMQGRMAGVQVTQNSGEPGGNVSVRIRGLGSINGSNEPLYIVDGVPYGNLNAINPNDIERIDVLKDAATAAIYGSRGTNGVVIVTTKRAQQGKVQVTLDAYAGTQSAARTLDLLDGPQFARLANENLQNGGIAPNPAWSNPDGVPNTDWQSEIFKPAPIQSYNVNISGGGEKSRSLLSVGYFDQGGILARSNYKRYTARLTTDYDITERIKVGLTINGAFENKMGTRTDGGNASSTQGGLMTAAISHPTLPLVAPRSGLFGLNPDGSIDESGNTFYGFDGTTFYTTYANPVWYPQGLSHPTYAYEKLREEGNRAQRFLAAVFGEYELIDGLKIRSDLNLTYNNSMNRDFWQGLPIPETSGRGLYGLGSIYTISPSQSSQWNWINTISYGKTLGLHNFNVLAGTDALKATGQGFFIQTRNNPNDQDFVDGSLQADRIVSGGAPNPFALFSYFGRATYDFAGKYLFSATVRRDGSSNFNPDGDFQFGVFPSFSAGWIISEESFMNTTTFINFLKLRGSYGRVGNQGIPQFQYLSTFANEGNRRRYPLGMNETLTVGTFPSRFGTADIRWESSTQTNFGIDASFLDNSISLTADYYVKQINDMLGQFPTPIYAGVPGNNILRNGFAMENSGIELSLGYNRRIGEVGFSTSANFATLNNRVTRLLDNETGFVASNISAGDDGGAVTRTLLNERVGNFWGYVADGIFQNQAEIDAHPMKTLTDVKPGDRRYKDLNGDGVFNDRDRTIIGNGLPKYTFGFNMAVDYKGFDLSVLLSGQAGVEIANQTKFWLNHMKYNNTAGGINNASTDLLQSWTPENRSNTFTRNSHNAALSNRWFSTFNIENGAFLRVRNLQLGYTLPETISQKAGMSRTRLYVAAQNLFTFTEYSGYDPEMGSRVENGRGNALQTGVDFGRYPVSKMFTGGVNFQF